MKLHRGDRTSRGGRSVLAAVLMALATSGATAAAADTTKPATRGELLSTSPIKGAPEGASAWQVRYRTLDNVGKPEEVTGIVVIPAGPAPAQGRDIVSWGRGTVGLAPVCAPSATPKKMFENTPEISDLLKHGWVIAASDFADPNSGRVHPYLVGLAEAHAMLDIVRAASQMPDAHVGKRYALWGESEGAHASLWSADLAPDYLPEFQLVGAAAAAPPTDLVKNFEMISNPGVRALITGYVTDSWSKVYGIPLSTFSNAFGRFIIHRLAKDCTRFDMASAFTNTTLFILSRQVPHNLGPQWAARLAENSLIPRHLSVPLLIAQGGKDDVVMPPLTRAFAQGSCRLGDDVRFIWKPDAGHLSIAVVTTGATVDWLADRFAGKPAPSDCAALLKSADGAPSAAHRAGD